jgi:hypothetical protein
MPETSTEEIGPRETDAASEPDLDLGRFDTGQFVKVTHLRPVADPSPPNREDRRRTDRESPPPALSPEEELTLRLRENRQAPPGPRWRLLRMLAPRSWRN